ncbi:MAG: sodium-dependent transporter [Firmicutes bacterium]|jgi:NSS family neurotransmitter:Na+ symporter|nr:sodium-dependent transporter [Bacillota bacterium]
MKTNQQKSERDSFNSRIGFVLACIGSAIGMGNIWLFPYRVGQYGGAAFLIPYFIFIAVIGFTGVIGEMSFGRAMGTGPLGAFRKASQMRGGNWGEWIGMIPVLGSLGIAIGYSVVVGWILRFFAGSVTGSALSEEAESYFGALASNFGSVPWHIIGLAIVFICMAYGISTGIEKLNKIMIPAFFLLFIIMAVRIFMLENAKDGIIYMLKPNWDILAQPQTWVYALGQAFFSLSLAGSGTIVYGSYLKKTEDVVKSAKNVALFDTLASLLAVFVIIPAVFAFGLNPASGPPLMFITMPKVFQMMPMGRIFAIIFFLAVFCAAVTSLVNLFETPVEALQEKFGLSRKKAVAVIAVIAAVVGVCIESGDSVSVWMDIVSIYIIPLGALLAAIMLFWVCGSKFAREQAQMGRQKVIGKWFEPMTKYVFVGLTLFVYIMGIFYNGIG